MGKLAVPSSDEAVAALSQVRGLQRARIRQHVADNFSQERMVDHYINVYKEVLRMEDTKAAPASPTFEQRPWGSYTVLVEGQEIPVATGGTMDVPLGAAHRIANPGSETLVLIEIQRGSYLGEDDIIRLQDDYGRTPTSA